ncbi:BREX-2 system adenine-specific DNA-methyltransferase PglX [Actinomadura latina]|uniref:site-specific DNA-methyltransferase (adenine-specific) n=1 Tax=Actinomadura latina TaxID=163603 RepID=A0A846ZDD3_9ACTN|nr:BREX-2 system adenine-specific DNA-methyltransferase PglX [Actinomadura latina]NKZ07966.1 BREX-2 system adenine-specific DNA-methyltransferase PglX [Actinomadura latina]
MIDRKALLTDLKKQVGALEGDLRERAAEDLDTHARLYGEWQQARTASRIAATYESWLDDRVTQAAVAWVLGTVFLRFCEDNGLIEVPFLAGPGERLDLAQERQAEYIRQHPHDTDRDWILAGFAEMSRSPVAAGLFDRAHNPMWQIEIPHHAAKALLAFWRRRGEDGEIVHDFTDPDWDTRFLGDLYQDLSEHAKKTYALLQTPEFVEEFILDYTLEPAVDEFGLAGLRLIDPTCGSGHFLLGAFHRILGKWRAAEPATDIWELIRRTLLSVHGVDKNPFAANIARFRLLAAVMKAGGVSMLAQAPEFPIIVATGDSLLHGRGAPGIQEDLLSEAEPHTYATEDIYEFIGSEDDAKAGAVDLLGAGSYHVVVGNPPYITVKDKQENQNYRAYKSSSRQYALSAPFAERFFQLAIYGGYGGASAGYVGQITANSFMKREFGKALIEGYLATVDLTHIVDSSGAYIPGHGTPTVILLGRRRWPKGDLPIRVAMGVRGEPAQPGDPAKGLVWSAIVDQIGQPGSESEWISVADVPRSRLAKHPWSLSGGGAAELKSQIEKAGTAKLRSRMADFGFLCVTREDDAYLLGSATLLRQRIPPECRGKFVEGDQLRDWSMRRRTGAVFTHPHYDSDYIPKSVEKVLWPNRLLLKRRRSLSGTQESRGIPWHHYSAFSDKRWEAPLGLMMALVSTHPQFALRRDSVLATQAVTFISLHGNASEHDYHGLLGVLNSSTACFWLKQVSHPKGGSGIGRGVQDEAWESRFEFTGTKLEEFPLPPEFPFERAKRLDALAGRLKAVNPISICKDVVPTRRLLDDARARWNALRKEMIAEQEELDWESYYLYGLLNEKLHLPVGSVPEVGSGERAFEILLAGKVKQGEVRTEWFKRHGITPVMEIPSCWPQDYIDLVKKRIEVIEMRRDIALIERPECKRRWIGESWDKQEKSALRDWLLERIEEQSCWFVEDEQGIRQPRVMTVNQLADQLRYNHNFVNVARLYAGDDGELAKVIDEITQDEHVPHLAALRYKDASGLRKRAQWWDVWQQQREEDRTGKRLDIPAPPKYASTDFLKISYWRNRGKLDVPKERFISYPESSPDGDSSMLLGWAGWDHREQAQALMTLLEERATQDGWDAARLTPLLAGLAEVLPWVRQWHGEVDPAFGQSPADAYAMYLEDKQRTYGISDDDLKNWRPKKLKRGGRRKKTS